MLLLGAGGLGSPAALYLAAAGVGTLGIVDMDVVDASNLQRQILHNMERIGDRKVDSAKKTLTALNPDVDVVTYDVRFGADNILDIIDGYDVILDGTDNFPTRYLLNDASLLKRIPVVHGSIFRFEGQVTVFDPYNGPCYRCLLPEPPPPELAPSCSEAGVLGVLPGIIGSIQALEAIKLLLDIGEPLRGRLLAYDALEETFRNYKVRRDPNCPACGEGAQIVLAEYDDLCLPHAVLADGTVTRATERIVRRSAPKGEHAQTRLALRRSRSRARRLALGVAARRGRRPRAPADARRACAGSAARAPLGAPAIALNAPLVGIAVQPARAPATGCSPKTAASSATARPRSTARPARCTSTSRSSASRRRRADAATGSSRPTAASSRFGDARFHGSTGAMHLNSADRRHGVDADGRGYWLVAADGGIFTFGDAHFHGSTGGVAIGSPVVGITSTAERAAATGSRPPTAASSTSATRAAMHAVDASSPIVGLRTRRERAPGCWLVASDGAVYTTGTRDVRRQRATGGLAAGRRHRARRDGNGYWVATGPVGSAAPAELRHRPPHRVLEQAAAHCGWSRPTAWCRTRSSCRAATGSRRSAWTTSTRRCRRRRRAI